MSQTSVEIEVQLSGAGKVEKGIQKIEGGLEGIGETGSKLTKTLGATNKKLGEGLESVSGTVGEVREAFGGLGEAVSTIGKKGSKGFLSLLGPLGMVASAGVAVYETFRLITGAAQEAEEAQEAMNAASSDLQSKLEMLAEKGVILSTKELQAFSRAVLESQLAKERIQHQLEKQRRVFNEVAEAQMELNNLTEQATNLEASNFRTRMTALAGMAAARKRLAEAIEAEESALASLNKEQRRGSEAIARAAEKEQAFEKLGKDEMRREALRLLDLEKRVNLLAEINETGEDSILQTQRKGEIEVQYAKEKNMLEDASLPIIRETIEKIKERTKALNEDASLQNDRLKALFKARRNLTAAGVEQLKVETELQKQRLKETLDRDKEIDLEIKARKDLAKIREAERKNRERKEIALQSRLNQMTIKLEKEGLDQALALENEKHRSILQLAKKGSLEEQVEEKRHLLAMKQIFDKNQMEKDRERQVELQKIQQANERELNLRYDLAVRMTELEQQPGGFGTEFERLTFESEQRLNILELEFQREINLAKMRGEEITSIQQKYALERQAITQETSAAEIEIIQDYFNKYAAGFAAAGYNALFFGESFKAATAQILKGLGEQAAVQALMETAKAFSALFYKDAQGFATSMKSAGLYTAAALAAGVASNALGGGGGGGTAAPATSPTGQPSTAPTPEREDVTDQGMVFNINFGGAVVYDTKKAAEQALADRLVSIINTPRRGAVQFNRR